MYENSFFPMLLIFFDAMTKFTKVVCVCFDGEPCFADDLQNMTSFGMHSHVQVLSHFKMQLECRKFGE